MKALVIGANGQLGTELVKALGESAVPVYHEHAPSQDSFKVDVRAFPLVQALFHQVQPDWVINTAAFHDVDKCESQPLSAFEVNSYGAYNVARAAEEVGAGVVYVSTDFVFGHRGPWYPGDYPEPLSVYGVSKAAGERMVSLYNSKAAIVRISGLFGAAGSSGKGGNFIETMVHLGREKERLDIVDDLVFSPTYAKDAAEFISEGVEAGTVSGIYHLTNEGTCTWKEFAEEIFDQLGISVEISSCTSESRNTATRPGNSVLSNSLGGSHLRSWDIALENYLMEKGYL